MSDIKGSSNFLNQSRFDVYRERGEIFHAAIDEYWKTGTPGDGGKYQAWVDSFLAYPNLKRWQAIATEFRLCDRHYQIAGTCDLILKNIDNGRVALCDYKTKEEKFSKGNHRVQMGGYLSLLNASNPSFQIDTARIYWVTPKETTSTEYDVIDCLKLYEQARNAYFEKQLPF